MASALFLCLYERCGDLIQSAAAVAGADKKGDRWGRLKLEQRCGGTRQRTPALRRAAGVKSTAEAWMPYSIERFSSLAMPMAR